MRQKYFLLSLCCLFFLIKRNCKLRKKPFSSSIFFLLLLKFNIILLDITFDHIIILFCNCFILQQSFLCAFHSFQCHITIFWYINTPNISFKQFWHHTDHIYIRLNFVLTFLHYLSVVIAAFENGPSFSILQNLYRVLFYSPNPPYEWFSKR